MWKCGLETEATLHLLLRWRLYSAIRTELLGDISTVVSLTNGPDEKLLKILLYVSEFSLMIHCFYETKNKTFMLLLC